MRGFWHLRGVPVKSWSQFLPIVTMSQKPQLSNVSKNLARALKKEVRATAAGNSALAVPLANQVAKHAKKHGKGKGFWGLVGGAAQMAAQLAPLAAGLFLTPGTGHAPTIAAAAQTGMAPPVAPLAAGSFAQTTGVYGMKPLMGGDGRVIGMRLRGCDYVGSITVDSEPLGTTLFNMSLNPMDEAWSGTQLQQQARLFERYRPVRVCCMVEPCCPATTAGQTLAFVDPDPDDPVTAVSVQGIQAAASHQGAGVAQVWQLNACSLVFDPATADYFADADGSDERLISPGSFRVLANTVMPAATTISSLYVIWEYEFRVPQLDDNNDGPGIAVGSGVTGFTDTLPFGTGTWADMAAGGELFNTFTLSYATSANGAAGSTFYRLPEGNYLVIISMAGTSSPTILLTVDGTGIINPEDPTDNTPAAIGGLLGQTGGETAIYVVRVTRRGSSVADAYFQVTNSTGAATVTGCSIFFVTIPDVYAGMTALMRRKTLQQFQREVLTRLDALDLMRGKSTAPDNRPLPARKAARTLCPPPIQSSRLAAERPLTNAEKLARLLEDHSEDGWCVGCQSDKCILYVRMK